MKSRMSTFFALIFMCILPTSLHSNPEPSQSIWQWLFGSTPTQKEIQTTTDTLQDECCRDEFKNSLCRILKNLNICCTDLENKLDEILNKFPCNGFTAIDSIPPITGYVIDKPGKYCVTADLTSSDAAAITIDADNVLLDFDFHSLTYGGSATAIQVNAHSNIIIKNPVIHLTDPNGFGIHTNAASNLIITRPLIDNTSTTSVFGFGIFLDTNTRNVLITKPNVTNCFIGIAAQSAENIAILDGYLVDAVPIAAATTNNFRITDTTLIGVAASLGITGPASNFFIKRCIMAQAVLGVDITSVVSNIFIQDCQISATQTGVNLVTSSGSNLGCLLDGCSISTNLDAGRIGINLRSTATYNSIENCLITNNETGILIPAGTTGTAIIGCTIRNNGTPINNAPTTTLVRDTNSFSNTNCPSYGSAFRMNNIENPNSVPGCLP